MATRTTTIATTITMCVQWVSARSVQGAILAPYFRGNMQLSLFRITEEEIFQAYYDCRKHKRNSREAMEFELDAEHKVIRYL